MPLDPVNISPVLRADLQRIADMVEPDSRVLDIGCETGDLLAYLWHQKNVDARGLEISQDGVHACVSRGLSVVQGDADVDLDGYPDKAFDYAILSLTLQATRDPKGVLANLVRISRHAVVSFPNFGHWRTRLWLLVRGRMPVSASLPYSWYETPNIHFCTITDFVELCRELKIEITRSLIVNRGGKVQDRPANGWANWTGEQGIFLLHKD